MTKPLPELPPQASDRALQKVYERQAELLDAMLGPARYEYGMAMERLEEAQRRVDEAKAKLDALVAESEEVESVQASLAPSEDVLE